MDLVSKISKHVNMKIEEETTRAIRVETNITSTIIIHKKINQKDIILPEYYPMLGGSESKWMVDYKECKWC